jgi:hypothetical protein
MLVSAEKIESGDRAARKGWQPIEPQIRPVVRTFDLSDIHLKVIRSKAVGRALHIIVHRFSFAKSLRLPWHKDIRATQKETR